MSRIIRTVSLNSETDALAAKKANFSAWVRQQLIGEDIISTNSHSTPVLFAQRGLCNPSAKPRCGLCFPFGNCTPDDIKSYNKGLISGSDLQSLTRAFYGDIIQPGQSMLDIVIKEPSTPPQRERKYVRRLVKWLIEWI
tara:strand:- start:1984 stop:2400 length:417 start_codon:yes stop_codon:yes gene_type:complete